MEKQVYRKAGKRPQARAGALLALFILLVFGFAVYNVFSPKRETSELENRRLAQLPAPSAKTLLNGQWADDLATYLQDQVAFRDFWIDLESAVNSLLFAKTEESDILLGKDGWMFTKLFTVSQ